MPLMMLIGVRGSVAAAKRGDRKSSAGRKVPEEYKYGLLTRVRRGTSSCQGWRYSICLVPKDKEARVWVASQYTWPPAENDEVAGLTVYGAQDMQVASLGAWQKLEDMMRYPPLPQAGIDIAAPCSPRTFHGSFLFFLFLAWFAVVSSCAFAKSPLDWQ